ncbi:MAG: hypothetical protein LBM74_01380 [Oscillospiraceae bacterium]|jgi:hypothetical protein|nr:hypothetical protein [Oscillospiraceae bacterium]
MERKAQLPARNRALDVFKGMLVGLMVYGHVLQFFGVLDVFAVFSIGWNGLSTAIFPGFVFAFGWAVSLAYLGKPLGRVWPRLLRIALKSLGAFYLSGTAYRVLRENKPFAAGMVRRILLLQDIPGWSEFLLAFALYALLTLVLLKPLTALRRHPLALLGVCALCLGGCFLPYEQIHSPYLGLLVGTRDQVLFPVLQHAPYFLLGLYFPVRNRRYTWVWVACAAISTGIGLLIWLRTGLPERFPPSIGWMLLPAGVLVGLVACAWGLGQISLGRMARYNPLIPVVAMGRDSLFYLLGSNLILFTLAGKEIAPQLEAGAWGLWGMPIQSPWGAFGWTLVLFGVIALFGWCTGIGSRSLPRKGDAR